MMRHTDRSAYTLIELIGAMMASSLLLLALMSTVVISTSMVEPTGEDGVQGRDRLIHDRLNHDLRFATHVDSSSGTVDFSVNRPDLSGADETLAYGSNQEGFTRTVNGSPAVVFDQEVPSVNHHVDGYSAPTEPQTRRRPRIRSVSVATTDGGSDSSFDIDLPAGTQPGDLIVLVTAYRYSFFASPSTGGWTTASADFQSGLALVARWQIATASTAMSHRVNFNSGGDVAAAMLAIEHPNSSWPLGWSGAANGTSSLGDTNSYPQPLENINSIGETTLSLQLFAATNGPHPSSTLGVASFTDCVNVIASESTGGECSLGIASRTGAMPSIATVPRVWHQEAAHWITIAIEVEGADE